jgi:hypothetical protein
LIHINNAVQGNEVQGVYAGEFEITCGSGVTAVAGAEAYYDEANRTVVTAPGAGIIYLGTFEVAKTSGQTVARVRLSANFPRQGSGVPIVQRFSVTAAQVNSGLALLPAVAGQRYRVLDAKVIAKGGNAAGATAVVLQGVQSTSTVSLMSATVGALTQNTWVGTNSANVTMLATADTQCDANQPLSIAKTGSNLTGATEVVVILTYELAP